MPDESTREQEIDQMTDMLVALMRTKLPDGWTLAAFIFKPAQPEQVIGLTQVPTTVLMEAIKSWLRGRPA